MARHRFRGVTLLNVTYDPLSRISLDHAISLVVMGKAEVFDHVPDEFIQGPVRSDGTRMRVPVPLMVILRNYADVPYDAIAPLDPVQATRMAILHRDGFICQYRNFMRRVTDDNGHVIHDQNENEVWERAEATDPEGVWKTCGSPASTWDHVVPQSQGGPNTWLNAVAACGPCNFHKADRTPDQANMRLVREPFVPPHDRYHRERQDVWRILMGQEELVGSSSD